MQGRKEARRRRRRAAAAWRIRWQEWTKENARSHTHTLLRLAAFIEEEEETEADLAQTNSVFGLCISGISVSVSVALPLYLFADLLLFLTFSLYFLHSQILIYQFWQVSHTHTLRHSTLALF